MNDNLIEPDGREQLVALSEEQVRWLQAAVATLEEVAVAERRAWDGEPHPITWIVDPDATRMCAAELRAIAAAWLSKDKRASGGGEMNRLRAANHGKAAT